MHRNEALLTKLFQHLNEKKPDLIADCYDDNATFRDIAFTLEGKEQIHAMWDMICSPNKAGEKSDITATVQELSADESTGRAVVIDDYTYRDTGRKVHNRIVSTFKFLDGKIIEQKDDCDAVSWAKQAMGGFEGFIAGHVSFIRRWKAMKKLREARPNAF